MTVYADVLFLVNFLMDLLCLAACRRVRGMETKRVRMLLSAAFGGVFGVFGACVWLPKVCLYALSVAAACVMCRIAFGAQHFTAFVRTVLLFLIANLLLGGLLAGLSNVLGNGRSLPPLTPLLLFAAVYAAMTGISVILRACRVKRDTVVHITLGQKTASFTVLVDSGDLLRDPYSGAPVILLSLARLQKAFPEEAFLVSPQNVPSEVLALHGWHLIPADTVSGGALLNAFVPDDIRVGTRHITAVTAVSPMPHFGGAEGLMPSALLIV